MSVVSLGTLSEKQREYLSGLLDKRGFEVNPVFGHVSVRNVKENHPRYGLGYLPVGFLGKDFDLVNTDKTFPEDYHSVLRNLYYASVYLGFSLN